MVAKNIAAIKYSKKKHKSMFVQSLVWVHIFHKLSN